MANSASGVMRRDMQSLLRGPAPRPMPSKAPQTGETSPGMVSPSMPMPVAQAASEGPIAAAPIATPAAQAATPAMAGLQAAGPSREGPSMVVPGSSGGIRSGLGYRTPPSLDMLLRGKLY